MQNNFYSKTIKALKTLRALKKQFTKHKHILPDIKNNLDNKKQNKKILVFFYHLCNSKFPKLFQVLENKLRGTFITFEAPLWTKIYFSCIRLRTLREFFSFLKSCGAAATFLYGEVRLGSVRRKKESHDEKQIQTKEGCTVSDVKTCHKKNLTGLAV